MFTAVRIMRRCPLPTLHLVTVLLLLAGVFAPADAQVVRGTLVEYPAGTPLPRAAVALLDTTGVAIDSTRSSVEGAFTLRAPTPGVYSLYFTHPGYASVPSAFIRLGAGQTVEHRFEVPLISGAAMRRMSETIDVETRLQTNLNELCGEELRSGAGMLVGVVRRRPGSQPLAGAIVKVEAPATAGGAPFRRATVTSANGVYVLCNVPLGRVTMRTELTGYGVDEGPVDVRAGEIGWYDVNLRARTR